MISYNTYDSAVEHPVLNSVLNKLIERFFVSSIGKDANNIQIGIDNLRQASWLASLLALSPLEEHKNKAMAFGTLAHLSFPDNAALEALCYTIQARTGNIPAGIHLENIVGPSGMQRAELSPLLDFELSGSRALSYCDSITDPFYGTDTQKRLWSALSESQFTIISAPTSAGKSFVIRRYIEDQLRQNDRFISLFIVPSKALITQVSLSLKEVASDASTQVWTSFPNDIDIINDKAVFILTQERCLRLLENSHKVPKIDFIFIDEIQKTEEDDRGGLLEYVLQEARGLWPKARIALAGPFIKDSSIFASRLLQDDVYPVETTVSPVVQLVVSVKPVKKKEYLEVSLFLNSSHRVNTKVQIDSRIFSKWHSSPGQAITDAVYLFSNDSQSIVYTPTKLLAEQWAKRLFDKLQGTHSEYDEHTEEINDLVDFLYDEISQDYSLAKMLQKRIAFHHAGVPDFIRTEIEELFANGHIRTLYCTSTLLEGVNLPAERIFVLRAKRGNAELEDFDFRNLIGRAGRISNDLFGIAFCVETDELWLNTMLNEEHSREIIPSTDKAIQQYTEILIDFLQNPEREQDLPKSVSYTACLLRNRLLKSEDGLRSYLLHKGQNDTEINRFVNATEQGLHRIKIPAGLCGKNPTVDPIVQDRLYKRIVADGIDEWLIRLTAWQKPDVTVVVDRMRTFREKTTFYGQFEDIMERLNAIFDLEKEANENHPFQPNTLRQMVFYAVPWMQGKRYRELINMTTTGSKKTIGSREVDRTVRSVMNLIATDICFVFVKYLKVLTDILRSLMSTEDQENYKYSLALPTIVELGCSDPCALSLMSHGVPRATAILLSRLVPPECRDNPQTWVRSHQEIAISRLHRRFLERLGIWKVESPKRMEGTEYY